MIVNKLLAFLLPRWFHPGIVEGNGGGAADEDGDTSAEDAEREIAEDAETGDKEDAADDSEASGDDPTAGSEGGETDEVVVTIGDEASADEEDESRAPTWIRDLRKANREKDRRIRELEQKVAASAPAAQAVVIGEKPTMQSCDFDADKFEAELNAWSERKRQADAQASEKQRAEKEARDAWQAKLDTYGKAKAALKVKDFEDAEEAALAMLNVTQQGVILAGAKRPELLIYAIGKNPKKAKELGAITDPVKFAFAAADLENQLKITPRKAAPIPERTIRSSVSGATAIKDTALERLQEQADKTGDRSKVAAYLRQKAQRAAA